MLILCSEGSKCLTQNCHLCGAKNQKVCCRSIKFWFLKNTLSTFVPNTEKIIDYLPSSQSSSSYTIAHVSASAIGLHSESEKRSKRPGLAWQRLKNAKMKSTANLSIAQFKVDWVIFCVVEIFYSRFLEWKICTSWPEISISYSILHRSFDR